MDKISEIRDFIAKCKMDWSIPGVAAAVVKDGEVFFAEGIGYRDIENKLDINPDTVMPVGSNTKTFATTILAMLADEGLIDWDAKVRDYIPEFALKDEYASNHATPRDLACHRTGLPRHDMIMMYTANTPLSEFIKKIGHLEPNIEFRSGMQYQNQMFMVLGYLIERITGKAWTEVVKERIFKPLGMDSTNCTVSDSVKSPNYSKAYIKDEGATLEIPLENLDTAGMAGAINSTLTDMVKYLKFHMNRGKVGDKQLVSEEGLKEVQTPQIVIRNFFPWDYEEIDFCSYGLGWFIESYRGHRLVYHGGTVDGFRFNFSFMPEEGVGVIVFTNMNSNFGCEAINYGLFDIMLDLDRIDWSQRNLEVIERLTQAAASQEKSEDSGKKPMTYTLEEYVGKYENNGYGSIEIKLENNELKACYNTLTLPLTHKTADIFTMKFREIGFETFVRFHTDLDENITSLETGFSAYTPDKKLIFKKLSM